MVEPANVSGGQWRPRALVAMLVVVLAFVAWDATGRIRHTLDVSQGYGVAVDAPEIDANSPTGYAAGRRSMVIPPGATDSLHWVMQTQEMLATGEWRVRDVDYDNAPHGREVHWASPLRWWLGLLAVLDHVATGRPLGVSVERAALWSGPVMFLLLVVPIVVFVAKRFSTTAAAVTALGAVAYLPFYIDFLPGHPDHHGLANLCGALTVLGLLVGSTADRVSARRWFAASGLAGGVGLWISASAQVSVLTGVGLGVMAAGWIGRRSGRGISWIEHPGLWRIWGLVGGATSFAAYAVEYFPHHLGLRLEVNHPLYAAAWIGAGEALRLVVLAFRDGLRSWSRRDRMTGGIAVSLVVLLPALIALTGATTFAVSDPFLWQLHVLYISEFSSLGRTFAAHGWTWHSLALGLPLLMLALPLGLVFRRAISAEMRTLVVLTVVPALLAWVLGWNQIRWLGLAYALSVPAWAVSLRIVGSRGMGTRRALVGWAVAGGLVFAPGTVAAIQRTLAATEFTAEEVQQLAVRDVAQALRQRGGAERVVVACSPETTSRLIFAGGLTGLGTLYWENAEGLKNASALFAASSATAAHEGVQRLGVTHIVVLSWDPFEVAQAKFYRGVPPAAPIPTDLFIANLLSAPLPPPWLRSIPFPLPDHPALRGKQVRIWEVGPDQQPAEALANAANYYLEMGMPETAERFVPALTQFSDQLAASVMVAAIASRRSEESAFAAVFQSILAQLSQAPGLSLEEHVHLVVVLTVGQRLELAREQLRLAVATIDEHGLRHLSPGTLSDLLSLGDALAVEIADPALRTLAQRLQRPDQRP